ncbi:MAG: putative porin [Nonlabens sp.]
MKKYIFWIFLFPAVLLAQVSRPTIDRNKGGDGQTNIPLRDKAVKVAGEKPPITDYLIISQQRDTTFLDTTLTIFKDYKFNYLRKNDFELMPFQNVGQPYNRLGRDFKLDQLTPNMGAQARHFNYYEIDDVYDYYVPTPLTELYFKTAINQGQQLDALFTSNLSPQFNFSISYKGVRSAGRYVNTLTSSGNFTFASSYFTKDKRYRLRAHAVFQDLENQESGGLSPLSLQGFLDEDEDLDDRGRLDPNLATAVSLLEGRRLYIDHDYELLAQKDSLSYYSLRIYNKAFYEDKFYRFNQDGSSENFLGESFSTTISDKTNFEQGAIEIGARFEHHLLGNFQAGIARRKFNYGYDRTINDVSGFIPGRIIHEAYQFTAGFEKKLGDFDFKSSGGLNVAGDLDGQFLNAQAAYGWRDFNLIGELSINSREPELNQQLFQSDYINYNWFNNFSNVDIQQLNLKILSDRYLNVEVAFNTIQDYVYFQENPIVNTEGAVTGSLSTPVQFDGSVTYLKIKAQKEVRFLNHFGFNATLMYQNVQQSEQVLNVPEFTGRGSLYYENRFFERALQLQAGITAKYFSSYFMDGYDPVLGDFYTQQREKFGEFPLIDLFVNAKVRQTRIFFKLEHANSPFSDPVYFSAPRHPYRDPSFRFGVVWDFFL